MDEIKKIKVFDDFFDNNDVQYIIKFITESESVNDSISRNCQNRFGAKAYFQKHLHDIPFFNDYCKQLFYNKIIEKKFRIIRCNLLSQAYGQSGSFHVDHPLFDGLTQYKNCQDVNSLEFTIMVYININDTNESNSSIIFKTDQKYIVEFETKHNRVLAFPGYYYHYPAHYIDSNDIRTAITFKCQYID